VDKCPVMTTAAGTPVADNQNSQTAGPRGPVLMQDYRLMEKMAHFNRERVPERVVHAKGAGAHGRLTITQDLARFTRAKLFAKAGNTCEMFARFSTVAGESGSADTARDPRGFSLKFYTEEGNRDLVGNNTPVFFVRDALKFSDFIQPNGFGGPVQDPGLREPPLRLHGDAGAFDPRAEPGEGDDFSQAGDLYRPMSEDQKGQLVGNLVAPLKTVPRIIQQRQIALFSRADADYGSRVAAALEIVR